MQHLQESIKKVENKILQEEKKQEDVKELIVEMKKVGIENLPYSYSALKRFIDPETMNVHYNKHYKGYVKKLNILLKNRKGDADLEKIIKNISRYPKAIRNNAGGAFNHALFWNMLSPTQQEIGPKIKARINKDFGTLDRFKKQFNKIATERFGSGWVWLVLTKKGTLKVMSTPNQDNPLMNVIENGGFPLLGLDLWEHAYYLKYKNKRDEYIKNFWTAVNWEFVERMYEIKNESNIISEQSLRTLINEGKSESCNREETEFYRTLLQNRAIKKVYSDTIMSVLEKIFSDYWRPSSGDEMAGVYNLFSENEGRSVINKLNTNFSVLCFFVKDMNRVLRNREEPEISFFTTPANQMKEMKRLCNFIEEYGERIFAMDSAIFKNIVKTLDSKHQLGEKREDFAKILIQSKLKNTEVEKTGRLGSKKDAIQKIDLEIKMDGVSYKCQVKGFTELIPSEGKVVVVGAGDVGYYPNIDWMVFVNTYKKKVVIFQNNPNIVLGNYVFDEKDELYNLS